MTAVFNAVVVREGRWYVARCPENGVTSQGPSIEAALDNLKEALALYFEDDAPPDESPRALLTTVEVPL